MLRLACVGLLAFLFARPYLLASRSAGEKQTIVVLIDQSATMELKQHDGTRSIERAVATVKDLLAQGRRRIHGSKSPFSTTRSTRCLSRSPTPTRSKPRDPGRSELLTKLVAPEACHGGDRLRRGPGMGPRRPGQGAARPAGAAHLHRPSAERPGVERGRCIARGRDQPSARSGSLGREQPGRHRGPARAGLAAARRADFAARHGLQRQPVHDRRAAGDSEAGQFVQQHGRPHDYAPRADEDRAGHARVDAVRSAAAGRGAVAGDRVDRDRGRPAARQRAARGAFWRRSRTRCC